MAQPKFITFLSDFGLTDDFVGTCHGVIKTIAPEVQIIDLTHQIRRHHILSGALILRNTLPYMPESVVLAVVDPGVGGARKPLAIRTAQGRYLVGPDNGLLSLAADAMGGADAIVELTCSAYSLPKVCKTFEGRDLFSPAAAHLTQGVALEKLGAPVDVDAIETVTLPEPLMIDGGVSATVVYTDRFGNVQVNLTKDELRSVGARMGDRVEVRFGDERWKVPFVESFAAVNPEELLVYEDSYAMITFAINQGDAARIFQIQPGDLLRFHTI